MNITSLGIKKAFGKKEVINNFSFEIKSSKITLILGPNGCGKTTWIKIALGLENSNNGRVLYSGEVIDKVRNQVSVVFDEPPVYPSLNGFDNLRLLSNVMNIKTGEIKDILTALNITDELLKQKCKTYSLGQRHRFAVACALIRKPKYLILDEPAAGLDFESWEKVKIILKKEAEKGNAIVLTGHNYDMMEELVDDVIIIQNGKVSYEGTVDNIKNISGIEVRIKIQGDDIILQEMDYDKVNENEFRKVFYDKNKIDNELLRMQEKGVKILDLSRSEKKLKDIYIKYVEENNNG